MKNIDQYRRYAKGKNDHYDNAFRLHVNGSDFVKPESDHQEIRIPNIFMSFNSVTEMEPELNRLKAKKETLGAYLDNFATQFNELRQRSLNEGRRPLKAMPTNMQREKHEAEAEMDVLMAEIDFLQAKIKAVKTSNTKTAKRQGLTLSGTASLQNGIVDVIDGQNVTLIGGVPVIDDAASPYDGMKTADYLEHVVKPHRSIKKKKMENLPEWPEGVKNQKAKKVKV